MIEHITDFMSDLKVEEPLQVKDSIIVTLIQPEMEDESYRYSITTKVVMTNADTVIFSWSGARKKSSGWKLFGIDSIINFKGQDAR